MTGRRHFNRVSQEHLKAPGTEQRDHVAALSALRELSRGTEGGPAENRVLLRGEPQGPHDSVWLGPGDTDAP